jgi:hypothetical protein
MNENIADLATDILEVGLDIFIDNEILKEIPILGSVVKTIYITNSVSDKILLRKLSLFLTQFEKRSGKQKSELLKKLSEKDDKRKIGESLMLLINRFDDLDKPVLLADLLHSYLNGLISNNDFLRIGKSINLAYIDDLKSFLIAPIDNQNIQVMQNLLVSGLSEIDREVPTMLGSSTLRLIPSENGKLFHKILA